MNTKKIILSVLGLGIVIGLGFFAVKSNNNVLEQGNVTSPLGAPVKPIENPPSSTSSFTKTITLKLNDKITFPDGLEVTLKEINDSRCAAGVQCIWAGEISGSFTLSGGKLSAPKEIRLGTVNNKTVSLEGYTFSLKEATKTSMTVKVEKN